MKTIIVFMNCFPLFGLITWIKNSIILSGIYFIILFYKTTHKRLESIYFSKITISQSNTLMLKVCSLNNYYIILLIKANKINKYHLLCYFQNFSKLLTS